MKLFNINRVFLSLVYLLLLVAPSFAQDRTVGVITHTEAAHEGYTLFVPQFNEWVFLINNEGQEIHRWAIEESFAVREAHLLENGNLIVITSPRDKIDVSLIPSAFPPDGSMREYTWGGELIWEYQFIGPKVHQHHGLDIMPSGNLLVIAWDYRTMDEALAVGFNPEYVELFGDNQYLLPDVILEIDRSTSEIVWKWDAWDHLVQDLNPDLPNYGDVSEHPNRIDINYQSYILKDTSGHSSAGFADWLHANMVNYNADLDQIAISVHSFDEFWIIDHSQSTEETSGSTGDLLYRWGNPFSYGNGSLDDRQLFGQHDIQWIDEGLPGYGNWLLFNNRNNIGGEEYSSILELSIPMNDDGSYDLEKGSDIVWSYSDDGFYSRIVSGAQRLPNGNTFITEGFFGRMIEVTPEGEVAWEYVNPSTRDGMITQGEPANPEGIQIVERNFVFRARKYDVDFAGFEGKDLTPKERLVE